MPEGKVYRAELEFLGKIDPSVRKSFEEFHKKLDETKEKSEEVGEHFKKMTERMVEFGIALFALEEAKRGMEWLIDSGKEYLATQFEINDALERQFALIGKGPRAISEAREELEKLADVLETRGVFAKGVTEKIEAALKNKGVSVEGIQAITPRVEAYFARRGQFDVKPEEAARQAEAVADFLYRGRGGPEVGQMLIGRPLTGPEQLELRKMAGKGHRPSPRQIQEWLERHMTSDADVMKSLGAARDTPLGQLNVTKNLTTDIAEQAGSTLINLMGPLARIMNELVGDDPTGKGSPLTQLLDHLNQWAKQFDDFVKSSKFTDDVKEFWAELDETGKQIKALGEVIAGVVKGYANLASILTGTAKPTIGPSDVEWAKRHPGGHVGDVPGTIPNGASGAIPPIGPSPGGHVGDIPGTVPRFASGGIFMAGEAGTEAIIPLKNPSVFDQMLELQEQQLLELQSISSGIGGGGGVGLSSGYSGGGGSGGGSGGGAGRKITLGSGYTGSGEPFEPDASGSKRMNAIFNNPGALGLGALAESFGGTASGKYDTGHPFAKFPTKEAGAAAQFALWMNKKNYLGHTLKGAITNWIGPGEHGEAEFISKKTGIPLDQVITSDFLRSAAGIRLMQAQAQYEGQNVLTVDQWQKAQGMAYKGMALGGLVSRATRALIGEAGPEMVIPMQRGAHARALLNQAASMIGQGERSHSIGPITLNITVHGNADGAEIGRRAVWSLREELENMLREEKRRAFA